MLVGGAAGGEAVLQRGGRLGVAELDSLRQSVIPSHVKDLSDNSKEVYL